MKNRNLYLLLIMIIAIVGGYFLLGSTSDNSWEIRNFPPREGPIIALGDSITSGVGAGPNESWPDQLATRLNRPIINRGVSGNETIDGLRRLERDVLSLNPSIVLVCLGGNDFLRKRPQHEAFENLRQIITQIQDNGAMVVLIGIDAPVNMLGRNLTAQYRALAEETNSWFIPNILQGVVGNPSLMTDQIHPNAAGYRIMADRAAETLTEIFQSSGG